jgi:hypothetical protein
MERGHTMFFQNKALLEEVKEEAYTVWRRL